MTALTVGSEAWWQSKNGPQWTREADGNYRVTFWWRDPQGSEFHSAIQRVWVYIGRYRSSPECLSSDDAAYCRNGCLAVADRVKR